MTTYRLSLKESAMFRRVVDCGCTTPQVSDSVGTVVNYSRWNWDEHCFAALSATGVSFQQFLTININRRVFVTSTYLQKA